MRHFLPKTIKSQITFPTIAVTLSITLIMITFSYLTFQSLMEKTLIQSTEFSLHTAMSSINKSLNDLQELSRWSNLNSSINSYLSSPDDKSLKLNAYYRLNDIYLASSSNDYIKRIMVGTFHGDFIQEVKHGPDSSIWDYERLMEAPYFQELIRSESFSWIGLVDDPMTGERYSIIPILRPIFNLFNKNTIGFTYIGVSTTVITDTLSNYPLAGDSLLLLTIGDISYQYRDGILSPISSIEVVEDNISKPTLNPNTQVRTISLQDGTTTLITYPSSIDGWYISQSLSSRDFHNQRSALYILLFISGIVVIGMGIFLVIFLNRMISVPILAISRKMNAISKGDFSYDQTIEWEHELGNIGKGINKLSTDVVTLMEKKISDEKHKQELEYQVLQSQINPHFLYNTLNSIKWMASIQHATGIEEMTTSLAQLLKSISKGGRSIILIQEELSLLKHYILIQQYRYGGILSIQYEIPDESVLSYVIPKFTLQPLVENAIFHGIEAKGSNGIITISILCRDNHITLDITDNGIGMSEELIKSVFTGDYNGNKNDFFREIGILNVNKRIKYTFGEDYGISIHSQIGQYTTMSIYIPCIKEEMIHDKTTDR